MKQTIRCRQCGRCYNLPLTEDDMNSHVEAHKRDVEMFHDVTTWTHYLNTMELFERHKGERGAINAALEFSQDFEGFEFDIDDDFYFTPIKDYFRNGYAYEDFNVINMHYWEWGIVTVLYWKDECTGEVEFDYEVKIDFKNRVVKVGKYFHYKTVDGKEYVLAGYSDKGGAIYC